MSTAVRTFALFALLSLSGCASSGSTRRYSNGRPYVAVQAGMDW